MRYTRVFAARIFADVARLKMASEITFVSEADIGFLSAVSLPNLSQALLENFLDSDHEIEVTK